MLVLLLGIVLALYAIVAVTFFVGTLRAQRTKGSYQIDNVVVLAAGIGMFWLPVVAFLAWDEWRYTFNEDWYQTMWKDWF